MTLLLIRFFANKVSEVSRPVNEVESTALSILMIRSSLPAALLWFQVRRNGSAVGVVINSRWVTDRDILAADSRLIGGLSLLTAAMPPWFSAVVAATVVSSSSSSSCRCCSSLLLLLLLLDEACANDFSSTVAAMVRRCACPRAFSAALTFDAPAENSLSS
jgi:hypothetical protein